MDSPDGPKVVWTPDWRYWWSQRIAVPSKQSGRTAERQLGHWNLRRINRRHSMASMHGHIARHKHRSRFLHYRPTKPSSKFWDDTIGSYTACMILDLMWFHSKNSQQCAIGAPCDTVHLPHFTELPARHASQGQPHPASLPMEIFRLPSANYLRMWDWVAYWLSFF